MQRYALIAAGGSGKRMGSEVPKQFLELAGKPVLMHTIERFFRFDDKISIILVLPENQLEFWAGLMERHAFMIPHIIVKGGAHRFFSVKNGLEVIREDGLVAIHDGVRPLVSPETLKRCFEAAAISGNAVPVISPADSMRVIKGGKNMPVNRDLFRIIQTPQVFSSSLIRKAYNQDYSPEFTDDATVLETTGQEIRLVEGNSENIKITTPGDLAAATALLHMIS